MRGLGCSHIQGYVYDQPLTAAEAGQRVAAGVKITASGPRSTRSLRKTVLRRVVMEHDGHVYDATVRNMSETGALIEGLWNVPEGTIFTVRLGEGQAVKAIARWCEDERVGMEFLSPIRLEEAAARPLPAPPPGVPRQATQRFG